MAAPRASVTHQADGADDHVVERLRRPLLLPEQVADHRPRRLGLGGAASRMTTTALVVVDEALAELVALLGEGGELPRRPPQVQQPQHRNEVVPVRRPVAACAASVIPPSSP